MAQLEIKLNENQINSLIQQYVSQSYSKSNIENRIYSYACQRINKKIDEMFNNGTLLDAISKRIVKDIPIEQLIPLIDKDKLNETIIDRVSKRLLNKIKLS